MSKAPHLDAFLEAADYFKGLKEDPPGSNYFTDPKADEMFQLLYANQVPDCGPGNAWCAMLVSAVACKVDVDWNVIYPAPGVGGVTSNTVDACNGTWIEGPYFTGGEVVPMPGDLVSFVGDPASIYSGYEHGGHIGIVREIYDSGFGSIEGNAGDMCQLVYHSFSQDDINGFVRPDWSIVGDDVTGYTTSKTSGGTKGGSNGSGSDDSSGTTYVPLYTTRNDRHDMTIREVCYLDTSYSLTNRSTGIGIGILNYTSFLADLYDYMGWGVREGGKGGNTKTKVDTSGLTAFGEDVKVAVDFFLDSKYSASAACGIVACLMTYSKLNVAFYDKKANDLVLEGIGAWEPDKYQEMRNRAGYDAKYTLSGQLDYVLYELGRDFKELVSAIKNKQLGSVQAEEVAKKVIWNYNKHYRHSDYEKEAKKYAKDFYDELVFTKTNTYSGGKDLRDIDGRQLTPQFTVNIPSDVPQAGIDGNFTSYSYWYCDYPAWAAGTPQRRIADQWAYEGFPYDRGSIALVGGYYCIGVSTTFGIEGDIVVVNLANGDSFAAILADTKNPEDSNYCEWGHYYENGTVNVIEWERIATYEGKVALGSNCSSSGVDGIELGSWAGQDVVSITNYGSYGI